MDIAVVITCMEHTPGDLRAAAAKSHDAAQGWRLTRLQPRPHHPKKDAAAQQAF
jgi:hypothetical protein